MTDAERLDDIRRIIRANESYLSKMSTAPSNDFWRGYYQGTRNLLNHIIETMDKEEEDEY